MSSLKQFRCEICRIVSENPLHLVCDRMWRSEARGLNWDLAAANSATARISVARLTPRYLSVAVLNRCVRRQSQFQDSLGRIPLWGQ
jgi:hypothetical protein